MSAPRLAMRNLSRDKMSRSRAERMGTERNEVPQSPTAKARQTKATLILALAKAQQIANANRLWSVGDLSEFLGVDERTLRRLRIPRIAIPGSSRRSIVRYDPAQVLEWLEAYRTRKTKQDRAITDR